MSGLTAARTASFPDVDCNVLCTTATQTMSNKIIDDTNSLTLYDNAIKIKSSTSAGSNLLLSIPNWGGTNRTWAFPSIYQDATFLGAVSGGIVNYGQTSKFGDSHTELYSFADGTKGGFSIFHYYLQPLYAHGIYQMLIVTFWVILRIKQCQTKS